MEPEQLSQYESRLRQMRETIASLETTRRANSTVVELDQTRAGRLSRMDALQQQAMANAGRERAATELRRIDGALARIRNGTFGECVECVESISTARLEAHPAIALCLACAQSREQR